MIISSLLKRLEDYETDVSTVSSETNNINNLISRFVNGSHGLM